MASITAWAKKVWKDRKTEYPTRRTLTKTDGSQEIVTVARNEGNVSQEGDAFSAANMNDLEERIDAGFTDVTSKLDNLTELKSYKASITVNKNNNRKIDFDIKLQNYIPIGILQLYAGDYIVIEGYQLNESILSVFLRNVSNNDITIDIIILIRYIKR